MTESAFPVRIAQLIADPDFQRLSHGSAQPNIFRAVGRTFTETWHSAFLGWLLDPHGSHNFGDFPIKRLLVTLTNPEMALPPTETCEYIASPAKLAAMAVLRDFSDAEVLPNERKKEELNLGDPYGRVDVWIRQLRHEDDNRDLFTCIIEAKVRARLSSMQGAKYADYLRDRRFSSEDGGDEGELSGVCVFISPEVRIGSETTSEEIVGDKRWYCMDYQALHDGVLDPCYHHPDLDPEMRVLLGHYIGNLREQVDGRSLAMPNEDRELAEALIKKYRDTLTMLAQVLADNGDPKLLTEIEKQQSVGSARTALQINIKGQPPIVGWTVPELLLNVIRRIGERGLLGRLSLPIGRGPATYILASEPIHPNGRPFDSKVIHEQDGKIYYFNTWYSRSDGLKMALRVLNEAGLEATPV